MPQIDPALACVWRSPECLQIGVDPARATLADISSAEERAIAALVRGLPDDELPALAVRTGLDGAALDDLLHRLRDAMLPRPSAPGLRLVIERSAPAATAPVPSIAYADRLLARHLGGLGHVVTARRHHDRPDVAIITAAHVVSPEIVQHWLSRDVPHLQVVTTDQAVTVGPLVVPGVSACLHCAYLAAIDCDAAWPAVAAQLAGPALSRVVADAPELPLESALFVGRLLDRLRSGPVEAIAGKSFRLTPDGGVSEAQVRPHPRCGCRALEAAARPRSATAAAATTGGGRRPRTTVSAPRVRG